MGSSRRSTRTSSTTCSASSSSCSSSSPSPVRRSLLSWFISSSVERTTDGGEVFCCFWRECSIRGSLQCVLLCYKVGDRRVRPHSALLLLHGDHGRHILVVDWHDRILCCLHVHPQDLWGSQDRLKALIERGHVISISYLYK